MQVLLMKPAWERHKECKSQVSVEFMRALWLGKAQGVPTNMFGECLKYPEPVNVKVSER